MPSDRKTAKAFALSLIRGPTGRAAKAALVALFSLEALIARKWASGAYHRLKLAQWLIPPSPSNFNHHIDLYYEWLATRNPTWLERGVLNSLALKGGTVLELTCGDGFNTRNFYSLRCRKIIACDLDAAAIATARRQNSAPNITYLVADIVKAFPFGQYQNIVWDFGYPITEFFSRAELDQIFSSVKLSLEPHGIFSGFTMAEDMRNGFTVAGPTDTLVSKEQLRDLLTPHFRNVAVLQTQAPGRVNFYFWASDGQVPFQAGWPDLLQS